MRVGEGRERERENFKVFVISRERMFMCPSKSIYWSLNQQCDCICRWDLWVVIRFGWGHSNSLHSVIGALRRRPELSLSDISGNLEECPHRNLTMLAAWLDFFIFRTLRNTCLLFNLSGLWYSCYSNPNWLRQWYYLTASQWKNVLEQAHKFVMSLVKLSFHLPYAFWAFHYIGCFSRVERATFFFHMALKWKSVTLSHDQTKIKNGNKK